MADNINVKPDTGDSAVAVATDDVGGVHYPLYKIAIGSDGEASLVSVSNGLPTTASTSDANAFYALKDSVDTLVKQIKISNKYRAIAHGFELTEEDL